MLVVDLEEIFVKYRANEGALEEKDEGYKEAFHDFI